MVEDTQPVSIGPKISKYIIFSCEPLNRLILNNTFLCLRLVVQESCWAMVPLIKAFLLSLSETPVLLRPESSNLVPGLDVCYTLFLVNDFAVLSRQADVLSSASRSAVAWDLSCLDRDPYVVKRRRKEENMRDMPGARSQADVSQPDIDK